MVVGRVNGCDEAATPAELLARMLDWLRHDEDASAVVARQSFSRHRLIWWFAPQPVRKLGS